MHPWEPPSRSTRGDISLVDHTHPADSSPIVCGQNYPSPDILKLSCGVSAEPGDYLTFTIGQDLDGYGVTNPSTPGDYALTVSTNNDPNPVTSAPYEIGPEGYWLVGSDGGIFSFGSANFYGSTGSLHLQRPVVGIVTTADHGGYWLDASDGGVFSFGDTSFYGSIPGLGISPAGAGGPHDLAAPIVGMVPSADDRGYFMVASTAESSLSVTLPSPDRATASADVQVPPSR